MAISRLYTFVDGVVPTAAQINGEFNNIINNALSLISPLTGSLSLGGNSLIFDAAGVTNIASPATTGFTITPGAKSGTPSSTGMVANIVASTCTDNNTAGSGVAALWSGVAIQRPTLAATNTSVTTTDAATLYIANAPLAGTNETLTNAWALLVAAGNVKLAGTANNLGTITTGTWNGSVIGATYGGTGLNSSASTGVPSISSGTWSVAATLATTLGGTGVNTSQRFKAVINNTYNLATASGTQSIAHGVTGTPKAVIIFVTVEGSAQASFGFADGTTNFCIRNNAGTTVWNIKTSAAGFMATTAGSDADNQAATITFDATNINLAWTKTGNPSGTAQINMLVFF